MNTKLVNTTAGVINAALTRNVTAAGIAIALESAGLLMTPEIAAELAELRARVAELETEREQWRGTAHRLAGEAGLIPREEPTGAARSADRLTALFAPVQALREDPHDGPLHHDYRVGRDLPESGGV